MGTRSEKNRKEKKHTLDILTLIVSFLALLLSGAGYFKDWHEQKEKIQMYVDYMTLGEYIVLEKTDDYEESSMVGNLINNKDEKNKERIFIDVNLD